MVDSTSGGTRPFSVSEITNAIKATLERGFRSIRIEGEVSNSRPSSTGHLYFSLKDDASVISAVLFRNRRTATTVEPRDGMVVTLTGSISVYPPRGSYQIIVEKVELSGEGRMLRMLEERKRRLAEEGLFDSQRKRPLPLFPARIAVVTSPTGAAIRDILRVLKRRSSGLNVTVVPTAVQGEGAASGIVDGIQKANRFQLGDVIIVTRGGGSLEDLLSFSDETVVRAVVSSTIPVISAVGHEVDTSLSDLAADYRAPTPSAAAEAVSASREELLARILNVGRTIVRSFLDRRERAQLAIRRFSTDELERSLRYVLQPRQQQLDDAGSRLSHAMNDRLTAARRRLSVAQAAVEAADPFTILARGYTVVRNVDDNTILPSRSAADRYSRLEIQFRDGRLTVQNREDTANEEL